MSIRPARRPHAVIVAGVLLAGTITAAQPASPAPARRCWGRKPTIVARPGQTIVRGTKGKDVIQGSRRRDVIVARGSRDFICGRGGRDTVRAGRGADFVGGGTGADRLEGGRGGDDLDGEGGNDKIRGGPGNTDYLIGGPGSDSLNGGRGRFDAVSYLGAPRRVDVNLQSGVATGEGRDALRRIEDIVGSTFDDSLTGNDSAAGNGFVGEAGNDSIDGGGGPFDIVFYTRARAAVIIDLNNGTASGSATGTDSLDDIEDAQGSAFGDTLIGSEQGNFLWGRGGMDGLQGKGGSDVLEAARGNDSLDGGAGFDYVSYMRAGKRTSVDLAAGTASVGDESDAISDIEGAYGSRQRDRISGSGEANELYGLAGSDRIFGIDGDDLLDGDLGRREYRGTDALDGGNDNDTCVNGETVEDCESGSQTSGARLNPTRLVDWKPARPTTR